MRSVSVQVQPELSPGIDIVAIAARFAAIASIRELVAHYDFGSGDDDGRYFNYTFGTPRPSTLWKEIQSRLYDDQVFGPHMKRASMAMCSDEDGWDHYLQLFHFDQTVRLDSIDILAE